jgi:hypothetical protein
MSADVIKSKIFLPIIILGLILADLAVAQKCGLPTPDPGEYDPLIVGRRISDKEVSRRLPLIKQAAERGNHFALHDLLKLVLGDRVPYRDFGETKVDSLLKIAEKIALTDDYARSIMIENLKIKYPTEPIKWLSYLDISACNNPIGLSDAARDNAAAGNFEQAYFFASIELTIFDADYEKFDKANGKILREQREEWVKKIPPTKFKDIWLRIDRHRTDAYMQMYFKRFRSMEKEDFDRILREGREKEKAHREKLGVSVAGG